MISNFIFWFRHMRIWVEFIHFRMYSFPFFHLQILGFHYFKTERQTWSSAPSPRFTVFDLQIGSHNWFVLTVCNFGIRIQWDKEGTRLEIFVPFFERVLNLKWSKDE